ncbi:hypothetical protein [Microvirga calopogonii]|uniref:hypothetical protein n=1 Tax=Microvirga calopogonii TaxID=2078013 RepID=UPI000E0DEBDC|nr:hypothetical protein [Microvirga calopogonii]
MRMKEIAPYLCPERITRDISKELFRDICRSLERSPPVEDREHFLGIMYGIKDEDLDLFDGDFNLLGAGLDWNTLSNPPEKEAKDLENKLTRARIASEYARAAKLRTETSKLGGEADEAMAKAKLAVSYVSR